MYFGEGLAWRLASGFALGAFLDVLPACSVAVSQDRGGGAEERQATPPCVLVTSGFRRSQLYCRPGLVIVVCVGAIGLHITRIQSAYWYTQQNMPTPKSLLELERAAMPATQQK